MSQIVLFDTPDRISLFPLTLTRPIGDLRVGILTIREKWELMANAGCTFLTEAYLEKKYSVKIPEEAIFIAGNLLPGLTLISEILSLQKGEALTSGESILAFKGTREQFVSGKDITYKTYPENVKCIKQLYDIFTLNGECIKSDFGLITAGRRSQTLNSSNGIIGNITDEEGQPLLFIEEGASVQHAVINLSNGPVYIGKDAEVMEGSFIRGPFALCDHSVVKMGSKIYEETTIGPHCKVGGEIGNTIFYGHSNKAHDGYIGNSVIGEWCNIGAGTNFSNLKNDYSEIKLWNYESRHFNRTGLQFCGTIMGDHSKIGIQCMLNTATVIGVGCNIHGSGYPRNFISSFQNGGASGMERQNLKKFLITTEKVMARRNIELTEADKGILEEIYMHPEY